LEPLKSSDFDSSSEIDKNDDESESISSSTSPTVDLTDKKFSYNKL
jgi:hypothetical protein